VFLFYVTNQEKLSSSVTKQVLRIIREDDGEIRDVFGDAIRLEPMWWMNGDGVVWGAVRV
jgi:cytochrome c oxidase assembly factor 1